MRERDRLLVGRRASFALAAALIAASAAGLAALVLTGDVSSWALVIVAAMVAGSAAALLAWQRAVRVVGQLLRDSASERDELGSRVEELEQELESRERELAREKDAAAQARRARAVEHDLNRQLRARICELIGERGTLGDTGDIRELVLRIALELLEAQKGLLLSRADEDNDGDLDLMSALGWDHDPEHSGVVQKFASEVLERDRTVRVEDVDALDLPTLEAADEEIENLVAIPIYVRDRFSGVVVCANKPGGFHDHDDEVLLSLGDHAGAVLQNARLHGELRTSYLSTIRMLADAIEVKDPFLRGHSDDVSRYVAAVAARLGLEPRRREELMFGSLLHDVGKIGISERILLKPAKLTPEERSIVELHPRIGYRIVRQVPALREIATGILHHHERFDGHGYPGGLKGEEIPLEARIICVADCFSAMTAERPYRPQMTTDEALAELERCAGTHFDPGIVRLFVEEVRERRVETAEDGLAAALADPELEARRGNEPLLGFASVALVDNLTLLYSHRYFHELVQAEAQRAAVQRAPFSIAIVTLTAIGEINRRDGYRAGDETIQAAARAVEQASASLGGTACRYSGTSFGLVTRRDGEAVRRELERAVAAITPARVAVAEWRQEVDGEHLVAEARAAARSRPADGGVPDALLHRARERTGADSGS